jgi:hypothetical protein
MPSEDTWLVPVEEVPDPFFMDRHHAYITKDNKVYVLSEDRTQAKEIGSVNGGGSIDLSNYVTKSELDPYAKKSEIKTYEGRDGISVNGNVISSPKLNELEQGLTDVETNVYNTRYTKGVRKTGDVVDIDHDYINKKLVTEKVDAVASTENYFPSVNNPVSKEYNLTMNPFDSKVVSAHLKIDLKRVTLMSGPVESQIQDKDAMLYIPVSIADGEYTSTTQLLELLRYTLWMEIAVRVKLTPTKMFVETQCYLTYTKNYQTIHKEPIDLIGNNINFSKEIPESKTVSYITRHVPYVGLILTKLKTFK